MGKVVSYLRSCWFSSFDLEHRRRPKSHPNKLIIPWNYLTMEYKFSEEEFNQLDNPLKLEIAELCDCILKVTQQD